MYEPAAAIPTSAPPDHASVASPAPDPIANRWRAWLDALDELDDRIHIPQMLLDDMVVLVDAATRRGPIEIEELTDVVAHYRGLLHEDRFASLAVALYEFVLGAGLAEWPEGPDTASAERDEPRGSEHGPSSRSLVVDHVDERVDQYGAGFRVVPDPRADDDEDDSATPRTPRDAHYAEDTAEQERLRAARGGYIAVPYPDGANGPRVLAHSSSARTAVQVLLTRHFGDHLTPAATARVFTVLTDTSYRMWEAARVSCRALSSDTASEADAAAHVGLTLAELDTLLMNAHRVLHQALPH